MIHGFGIFDMHNEVKARLDIHYAFWSRMIERCFSAKSLTRSPRYKETLICDEWKYFSNFRKWSEINYISGYVLDKDIAFSQLNIYSPETCAYVPQELNKCILDSYSARGDLPLGVWYKKPSLKMTKLRSKPYIAELNNIKLGSFETKEEAHRCWQIAKIEHFKKLAILYKNKVDEKVINGILKRASIIQMHFNNNILTNEVSKMQELL